MNINKSSLFWRVLLIGAGLLALADRFGKLQVSSKQEEQRIVMERLIEVSSPRVRREEYARFRELAAAILTVSGL